MKLLVTRGAPLGGVAALEGTTVLDAKLEAKKVMDRIPQSFTSTDGLYPADQRDAWSLDDPSILAQVVVADSVESE